MQYLCHFNNWEFVSLLIVVASIFFLNESCGGWS